MDRRNSRAHRPFPRHSSSPAFTLIEMLVAMAVLALLVILIAMLLNSASATTTQGTKHLEADAQATAIFDRMAIDFSRMVKRTDVDYFLKSAGNAQAGNDQLAFFSQVPGYSSSTGSQSLVSVAGYRIKNDNFQRYGTGLSWNGSSTSDGPMIFLPLTIAATWPNATSNSDDPNYETASQLPFRFEYFYVLKGATYFDQPSGTFKTVASTTSDTPWDTRISGHTSMTGLQDVAAIGVMIAVIDSRSRNLISNSILDALAAKMPDYTSGSDPGSLQSQWQAAVYAESALPKPAMSAIRIYWRYFYLPPTSNLAQ